MSAADRLARHAAAVLGPHRVVTGVATVDLDRAEAALLAAGGASEPAADDELLGARCRIVNGAAGSEPIVLLEPSTEGRLAATLARHGEGIAVTYLVAEVDPAGALRAAGLVLSAEGGGPLGSGRLVLGGDRWGPHVIAVRGGALPPATTAGLPSTP